MKLTINALDPASINAAIKALNDYKKGLEDKVKKFAAKLAEIGREGAEGRFSPGNVIYDGTNDVVVTAEEVGDGWVINADGKAVCFIEFGTGKFYQDTNRTYGGTIPEGVVDIGKYGHGGGGHPPWTFKDIVDGHSVYTWGNPGNLCLYYTSQEMRQKLTDVAKEVFANA